jgi:hypothetical protein
MNGATTRPGLVTAIGWIFVALALLMILSAAGGLAVRSMMDEAVRRETLSHPAGVPLLLRYFRLLCALQIVLAALLVVSAVQFLRLRAWARTVLEAAMWLGLTCVIGFGIFWVVNWLSMSGGFAASGEPPDAFTLFGAIMGSVVTLVFAVPCVIFIWLLRGAAVRQAMRPRRAG